MEVNILFCMCISWTVFLAPPAVLSCMPGCTCEGSSVSCSNILSFLPHAFSQRTTNLTIRGSFIGPHFSTPLSSFMNLEVLNLPGNNIHSISGSVLKFLRRLRYLNLSHNHLVRFEDFIFEHLSKLEVIDLSFNDFFIMPDVPFRFLDNIRIFNMSYNRLPELKLGLRFQVMTKLEVLDLSGNSFNDVGSDALEMAQSWLERIPKTLDLSNSNISSIQPGTFRYFPGLTRLSLAGNVNLSPDNLTSLFNSTDLSKLTSLDLSHMMLSRVSEVLQSLKGLSIVELRLSNNSIREMPTELRDYLRGMKILYADRNDMTTITRSITDISSLEILDLSHNKLSNIHNSFQSQLTNLRELYLGNNHLADNTVKVQNCRLLKCLDLRYNFLTNFTPPSTLSNLQTLHLQGNSIGDLHSLSGLSSLQYFDISNNKLQLLRPFIFSDSKHVRLANFSSNLIRKENHQAFRPHSPTTIDLSHNKLTKLLNMGWVGTKAIDLHGNKLVAIDDQAFYALYSLNYLNLGQNNFSFLQPDAFLYLTNVTELVLSQNKLHSDLEVYSVLQPLANLEFLDLSFNSLDSLRQGSFGNTKLLSFVNLSNNLFVNINPFVFQNLDLLQEVDLSYNHFVCDCELLGLRDWLRSTEVKLSAKYSNDSYVCKGPSGRTGDWIWRYETTQFECDQTLLLIIIFSSVGGMAMVVGAISATVCHFYCKWRKSRSYGIERSSLEYTPVQTFPLMNGEIPMRKHKANGGTNNRPIPGIPQGNDDLEVEMLLKRHERMSKQQRSTKKVHKNRDRPKSKHTRGERGTKGKRNAKPSHPISAIDRDAFNRYLREVRFNKYREMPRMQCRSETDLRPYHRSRLDINRHPVVQPSAVFMHRNPRLSRDMADIVRIPSIRSLGRIPSTLPRASTLPSKFIRPRPQGPRSGPGYHAGAIRGAVSTVQGYPQTSRRENGNTMTDYTNSGYSRGYNSEDRMFQMHPGYYTIGGKMSTGQKQRRVEWI